jgi:phosphate transport system permease protein
VEAGALKNPVLRARRNRIDRIGDPLLRGLSGLAAALAVAVVVGIVYEVIHLAWPAIQEFGIGFVTANDWNPVTKSFGGGAFLYGTAVTSFIALLFAAPLSIAISIYLTELAPKRLRRPVATLIDMLAAIPTVILGLWGILVLGPFMRDTIEPALKSAFGFLPIFSGDPSAFGYLTAAAVLTIMAIPIITSVTREVFETVPGDLKEASYALGATRWEMVRQVVLPYSKSGIVGAIILGLGRAIGEAIAVAQVIGGATGIDVSLFHTGGTLAAHIAATFQGAPSQLQKASLAYLGLILLVFAVVVNVIARIIVQRGQLKDIDLDVDIEPDIGAAAAKANPAL